MTVRLYGYAQGEASFAQVTRGILGVLARMEELSGFYPVDSELELAPEELRGGVDAKIGLVLGHPDGLLRAHRSGAHAEHWLLLAPNSEGLPHGFAKNLRQGSEVLPRGTLTGGLLTPSAWARTVLANEFGSGLPILVAPHGVTPGVHHLRHESRDATRRDYELGLFNVLHMTSTEAERKGTRPLLRAFKRLKDRSLIPKTAKLHILMNPVGVARLRFWASSEKLTDEDVVISPGPIYSQVGIAALYSAMHVICQPSRAEGFGLVPLEALACGVPVVATICTGHSEYLGPTTAGLSIVEHGPSAAMDDYPGSRAPVVSAEAIEVGLARAYSAWTRLDRDAALASHELGQTWSWDERNTNPLYDMIQGVLK